MPPPIRHSKLVVVSPYLSDHTSVESILCPDYWQVYSFLTGSDGLDFLSKHHDVAVVICADHLPDGGWRQFMRQLTPIPGGPSLIVSARLGDERLWAEALNLGAFDVLLSAPFQAEEVVRVTESAWLAWNWAGGRSVVPRASHPAEEQPVNIEFKARVAGCAY